MYKYASNEPDVYETSDLPEDDQAQFESVSICGCTICEKQTQAIFLM
uniref:Uncharacterized protein n=1 Tax=Cyprinus carpio TaxID=7962 RepID=A0A8C2F991_CYPCA